MMESYIQIHFLCVPLNRVHCLLTRVSYGQSMSIDCLVSYVIMVSKEVWNNLLAWAYLSSRTYTIVASLLLFADQTIIHFFSYTTLTQAVSCQRFCSKGNSCCFFKFAFVVQSLDCIRLFCDPMDYNPPGSFAHGISQTRMLEGLPFPFLDHLDPGIESTSPAMTGEFFTTDF